MSFIRDLASGRGMLLFLTANIFFILTYTWHIQCKKWIKVNVINWRQRNKMDSKIWILDTLRYPPPSLYGLGFFHDFEKLSTFFACLSRFFFKFATPSTLKKQCYVSVHRNYLEDNALHNWQVVSTALNLYVGWVNHSCKAFRIILCALY